MEFVWTPKRQGDAGELSAMSWLVAAGAIVCKPLFESPDYDLVADFGDRLVRVQVKTSSCWRDDRWQVTLATRGGNRSWSGLVKRGRRWYIPASALGAGSGLILGGPKYAEYEVGRGEPLPARAPPPDAAS
jgi:hypothetical protein